MAFCIYSLILIDDYCWLATTEKSKSNENIPNNGFSLHWLNNAFPLPEYLALLWLKPCRAADSGRIAQLYSYHPTYNWKVIATFFSALENFHIFQLLFEDYQALTDALHPEIHRLVNSGSAFLVD